jgi:hypothetical protein
MFYGIANFAIPKAPDSQILILIPMEKSDGILTAGLVAPIFRANWIIRDLRNYM